MRKGKKLTLLLALITAFVAAGLFLPGLARAGELEPPAGPDDPASAMYTIEDIYHYLDTGVKGTKRTGGFVEPTSPPGPTGHSLDEVHDKIGERCITCEGTLVGTRWCDNGNGTVTDMTTGLVWLKNAGWGGGYCFWVNTMDGTNALDRAAQLKNEVGGLTDSSTEGDWRLPTRNELYTLAHGTEQVRSGTPRAFTGVQSWAYWSSTTYAASTDHAWTVHMSNGSVGTSGKSPSSYYVWPVRSGN